MTLARVNFDYPVDEVVNSFRDEQWDFGTIKFDAFTIDGERYEASSGGTE